MTTDILVIDDDPAVGKVIELALSGQGYHVLSLTDGRDAMTQLQPPLPSVILLDLNMPLISGWEVHAQIKKAGLPVAVVYMTAGGHAREEAERFGAAGFLSKPFDLNDLVAVAERFAGSATQ